jgi:hypothetical protein
MSLISQPGSDYQLARLPLDAGNARDIVLLLVDVHAVLDHLYLDGTQPAITAPAEDYLRESASPYTLPALNERPRRGDQPARPRDPRCRPARPAWPWSQLRPPAAGPTAAPGRGLSTHSPLR